MISVERALTRSTVAAALAKGLLFSVSTLYLVQVDRLPPSVVGLGLTIAGAVGVAAAFGAGLVADRLGARRVLIATVIAEGIGLAAYLVTSHPVAFVVAACVVVGGQGMERTARTTVIAASIEGADRVRVRARIRVVMNVFIAVGTGLAALALLVGSTPAYVITMAAAAGLMLASAVPLRALPPTTGPRPARSIGRSPLRDPTYLTVTALNAVMCVQFGMLTVGVPLWVTLHTGAPPVTVALTLAVNTGIVVLLQARAARGAPTVPTAGRSVLRAGLLLAIACGLYAAAAFGTATVAVGLVLAAAVAHSLGEILAEAGSWTLAFDLADPRRVGAYQGVSQTGPALGAMLAPLVVTTTAIQHGPLGWSVLAALYLAASVATFALSRDTGRRVPAGQRSEAA